KKLGVLTRDPLVPVTKRFPFPAVGRGPKDVALACKDEIGMNRELKIRQARFEQFDGPAGVDRPNDAVLLKLFDIFHAAAIEHGIAAVRDECAVEVGAEKADFGGHRDGNLGFDFVTAIRLRLAPADKSANVE